MISSNVTFAENATFSISNDNNKVEQVSNLPNNIKDKEFFNSDNTSSAAAGNNFVSNLLYNLSDFVDKPSQATLKKHAYSAFEKFASTLPSSTDLIPPTDDLDDYSEIEADDPDDPYDGIFK